MRIHSLHRSQITEHLGRRIILEADLERHRRPDRIRLEIVQALQRPLDARRDSFARCFRSQRLRGMKAQALFRLRRFYASQPCLQFLHGSVISRRENHRYPQRTCKRRVELPFRDRISVQRHAREVRARKTYGLVRPAGSLSTRDNR